MSNLRAEIADTLIDRLADHGYPLTRDTANDLAAALLAGPLHNALIALHDPPPQRDVIQRAQEYLAIFDEQPDRYLGARGIVRELIAALKLARDG